MTIWDKVDLQANNIIRDKEGILQEYITILSVYIPNNTTSNYMKQRLTELKGK